MRRAATHVYAIAFSDGVAKVGRTAQFSVRFGQLSNEARVRGAAPVAFRNWQTDHANEVEAGLKGAAAERFERESGFEYFRAGMSELLPHIEARLPYWGFQVGALEITPTPIGDRYTPAELARQMSLGEKFFAEEMRSGRLRTEIPLRATREEISEWLRSLPHDRPAAA